MPNAAAMPSVFVGHGNPMNAITDTPYTRAWKAMGQAMPRPRAILAVSAHWYIDGTAVTAMEQPRTIHDFGGFPRALFEVHYPAPGSPEFAKEVAKLLAPTPVRLDTSWGLDHAAWSVLVHAFPKADVPVVELAIDERKSTREHFEIGRRLAPLRESGVLIMGSGNIVHNLDYFDVRAGEPEDWAVRFDRHMWSALQRHDDAALIDYQSDPDARLAAPDIEHFLPLLYVAGTRRADDAVETIVEGIDAGAASMRAIRFAPAGK